MPSHRNEGPDVERKQHLSSIHGEEKFINIVVSTIVKKMTVFNISTSNPSIDGIGENAIKRMVCELLRKEVIMADYGYVFS